MRILIFLLALCLPSLAWANCNGATLLRPLTSHVIQLQSSSAVTTGGMGMDGGRPVREVYCARFYSEVLSYITIAISGASPTATTGDVPMPAGHVEYFKVYPGEVVGVIRDSSAGQVTITEMTQ